MKPLHDGWPFLWPQEGDAVRQPAAARQAGARLPQSPHQIKADRTTQVARELTDLATEQRHAKTARLRQARLDKAAVDKAVDESTPAESARGGKGRGRKAGP